eukprot:1582907-Alexandrium_andersonii.AAC.1
MPLNECAAVHGQTQGTATQKQTRNRDFTIVDMRTGAIKRNPTTYLQARARQACNAPSQAHERLPSNCPHGNCDFRPARAEASVTHKEAQPAEGAQRANAEAPRGGALLAECPVAGDEQGCSASDLGQLEGAMQHVALEALRLVAEGVRLPVEPPGNPAHRGSFP